VVRIRVWAISPAFGPSALLIADNLCLPRDALVGYGAGPLSARRIEVGGGEGEPAMATVADRKKPVARQRKRERTGTGEGRKSMLERDPRIVTIILRPLL
jgi:hypothetical protein